MLFLNSIPSNRNPPGGFLHRQDIVPDLQPQVAFARRDPTSGSPPSGLRGAAPVLALWDPKSRDGAASAGRCEAQGRNQGRQGRGNHRCKRSGGAQ